MSELTISKLDALKAQATKWEDAQKPVPEGVYPVFLGPTTQEKFGCRPREEVTKDKPYVYVTKKFFLEDIQFRGAISDFHPMKVLIEKYPEDALMLVWDHEEWYGQNHFVAHDLKVKNALLADEVARKPPEEAAAGAEGGGGGDGGGGGGGGGGEALEVVKPPPPESPAVIAQKAAAAAQKAAAAATADKVAAVRAEVSAVERTAAAKRINGACAELETWLKTTDDQVNHKMAAQDLLAHHVKVHQDMLHYLAREAARAVKVQPHHIEVRVKQHFGINMMGKLATIEARSVYPIEEPIIEPLTILCEGTDVEPESLEKFITDLRTDAVEGRNGPPAFDFVKHSVMTKTASPRDVVALAKLLEKMLSGGGVALILDDIIDLPNGPEAEKLASSRTDRPRTVWVTPTLAVMPQSRSRLQRSIVVDYSTALVKGF